MQRLGGRLQEVVSYKSQIAKAKFKESNNESLLSPANYW